MRRLLLSSLALLFAASLVTLFPSAASARTYSHGHTVWFDDARLGDGDEIDGQLNVVGGSVVCLDGATIHGDVNTYFGSFTQSDGCTVDGTVNSVFGPDQLDIVPWFAGGVTGELLAQNKRAFEQLAYGVIVVLVFLLFPLRVRIALERVERHPGLSAGVGTVALVAVIPVAILLVLSIIGIPLIAIEIAAVLAGMWIGQAAIALLVGRRLHELVRPHQTPTPLAALLLGLVFISAAEIVPVVGWAVTALVWLVGLGAAILAFVRESSFQSFVHPHGASANSGGTPMKTV